MISWGAMVHVSEQAIKDSGVSCDLIDLQTLVPWDKEVIVKSIEKTGRCVIVHEAPKTSGFGAEMAAPNGLAGTQVPQHSQFSEC